MKVNYRCKDNDARLQFHYKDGVIDEVWVQIDGEKSWVVVGYNDLIKGIKKAESKSKPKTSHDFGGGYIGEALFYNLNSELPTHARGDGMGFGD